MNKILYLTRGNNIVIDTENNSCDKLQACRTGIDYIYRIKEPTHVVYGHKDEKFEFDCDKDDIIITFYLSDIKQPIIVVKSKDWIENIEAYDKAQQEEKERWAAGKNQTESTSESAN